MRKTTQKMSVYTGSRVITPFAKQEEATKRYLTPHSNQWFVSWPVAGLEINNYNPVNIKVVYYKYVKRPELNYSFPI